MYLRDVAAVSGWPALYTARLLRHALRESGAMDRARVIELVETLRDLERAADAWRQQHQADGDEPEPPPADPDEIDTGEAAGLLGLKDPRWVRTLAQREELDARKVGGRWLVDRGSVFAYREARDNA